MMKFGEVVEYYTRRAHTQNHEPRMAFFQGVAERDHEGRPMTARVLACPAYGWDQSTTPTSRVVPIRSEVWPGNPQDVEWIVSVADADRARAARAAQKEAESVKAKPVVKPVKVGA